MAIDYSKIPSPCYVLDENRLRNNLSLLKQVKNEAGVKIILAFKGFAMWSTFPIVRQYLDGATASSLNEARLCYEEMDTLAHLYAPAYSDHEFNELMKVSSHITFNSLTQYHKYRSRIEDYNKHYISPGLRVNPEFSDVETELYNPASPHSRLGLTHQHLKQGLPEGIEGLHFHVLCESNSYSLEKVLSAFEQRFGKLLPQVKWVNMGGGHLITGKDYDTGHLIRLLTDFKKKYDVDLILEPGSAIAWETGNLVSTVMDIIVNNHITTAILDVSFTCHMPDCLEMPYNPNVINARPGMDDDAHSYHLGGLSCLAGDSIGPYSFDKPLEIGDRIIFRDMIHYTMVKTTNFNGVQHPSIGIWRPDDSLELVKEFSYSDYKNRLS